MRTKYEVFHTHEGYYVQTHCECGSTMSSGEYLSTANAALAACQDGLSEHKAEHIRKQVAASKVVPDHVAEAMAKHTAEAIRRIEEACKVKS